jgi:spore coat polysaccharide biosynthesis protein SpsF (cytidylyltransferase family)
MNIHTLVILQARMSSRRLPGKVLLTLNDKPIIYWQIKRILRAKSITKLVVAISVHPSDDILANYLDEIAQEYIRGPLDNVLERFIQANKLYNPQSIVRITGDCPFVMPEIIDSVVNLFNETKYDYVSNVVDLTFPDGLDVEVFKANILEKLMNYPLTCAEKEHVTLGILNRKDDFIIGNYSNNKNLSHYRWTVDTAEDYNFVSKIFANFRSSEVAFTFNDIQRFIENNPGINQINRK